jgi:peptidoglycan/xylan/chitin deacetylase (PgdA/CDA1 family)
MLLAIFVLLNGIVGFICLHAADAGADVFLQMIGMAAVRPPAEADAGSAPADADSSPGGEALAGIDGTAPALNGAGQAAPALADGGVRTADALPWPASRPDAAGIADPAELPAAVARPSAPSEPLPAPSGRLALTFDDGPDGKYTPKVLDILAQYGVTATFFVVGVQAEQYPEVLARIRDEGHEIGSHGYAHANMGKMTAAAAAEDLRLADEAIREAAGVVPELFRPPYGSVSEDLSDALAEAGKTLVRWNVDPRDWDGTPAEDIVSHVLEKAEDGAVILLHSFGGKNSDLSGTIEALPAIIEGLLAQGFELTTVSGLEREGG